MAKLVERIIVGIDVCKDTLEIHRRDTAEDWTVPNTPKEVAQFLKALPDRAEIAVEPTGRYHELLVGQALNRQRTVYLVSGYRLNRYREAIGQRAKTDASDARLLARYLDHEGAHLRPVTPRSAEEKQLWQLLRRRACVVHARTAVMLSLRDLQGCKREVERLLAAMKRFIDLLELNALKLARSMGWQDQLARVESMPGLGKLSALALVLAWRHAPFRGADAYVAFMGLDVRVRDSGRFRGKRRLTKQGDPEIRRLLFLAGRNARRFDDRLKAYFERMIERGHSKTAADMAVGRKLARIAFSLLKNEQTYRVQIA